MLFKFADKPMSSLSEYWVAGFKLYVNAMSKIWYLVFVVAITGSLTSFMTKIIDDRFTAQNHVVAMVVYMFAVLLITCYFINVTLHRMYFIGKNEPVKLADSFSIVWQKYTTIVIAMLITVSLTVLGGMLLIIPGLFVSILLIASMPLILFDNAGAFSAIGGSVKLVWGNWWRTFSILIPVVISSLACSFLFGTYFFANKALLMNIANIVIFNLIYPFFYVLILIVFNDLKLRKQV